MKARVVIGANFGDEGKGLMTEYFCHQAISEGDVPIIVLNNGGAQRGHTVVTPNGERHVFKHFGSGSFEDYCCVPTYFSNSFIVNPITFNIESRELGFTPECYISPCCRVTTPWDMMANIIIEESRGLNKHGSCGMGIWETVKRCGNWENESYWSNAHSFNPDMIRKYYEKRFEQKGIVLTESWRDLFYDDAIQSKFCRDVDYMKDHVKVVSRISEMDFIPNSIIIENGQGLLLDSDNIDYYPNVTASNTGVEWAVDFLRIISAQGLVTEELEVCYVSRTYMTRHGEGRFDTECDPAEISEQIMADKTNIWNPHQGHMRYGKLDIEDMVSRCKKDFNDNIGPFEKVAHMSFAFTHADEYEPQGMRKYAKYISTGETRNDIKKVEE